MSLTNNQLNSIKKKSRQLHETWNSLAVNYSVQLLQDLHRLTHQLFRLCDNKELAELAVVVKNLQVYFFSLLESPTRVEKLQVGLVEANLLEVDRLILNLTTEIMNPVSHSTRETDFQIELDKFQFLAEITTPPTLDEIEMEPSHKVGLIDRDKTRAQELADQLQLFGYEVVIPDYLPTPEELKLKFGFAVAIIELEQFQNKDHQSAYYFEESNSLIPLIFLSTRSDVADRLLAVKNGGTAFFARPPQIRELVDQLDSLTTSFAATAYRILIVDDSRSSVAFYANVLQTAGMLTRVVTDPLQIIQPLIEFGPDLILMDMHMPGCTGLELAAVIRQQPQYVSVPIVFLSAETNLQTQLRAYQLGGDDFLTKPIQADHLVSLVNSRSERHRILRSFIERDSLTGLLNQARLRERLASEITRARRLGSPLAFAMLDIDHFKIVNDTYGHPVGDRVIKNLSRLLLQRLRRTDIIGRYGGEEFAVILPDTTSENAVLVLNELREKFAHFRQYGEGTTFFSTISGGVASFPVYGEVNTLCNAADQALYKAKRAGRNQLQTG